MRAADPASVNRPPLIAVANGPGAMPLTRTPWSASSIAACRTELITAAFARRPGTVGATVLVVEATDHEQAFAAAHRAAIQIAMAAGLVAADLDHVVVHELARPAHREGLEKRADVVPPRHLRTVPVADARIRRKQLVLPQSLIEVDQVVVPVAQSADGLDGLRAFQPAQQVVDACTALARQPGSLRERCTWASASRRISSSVSARACTLPNTINRGGSPQVLSGRGARMVKVALALATSSPSDHSSDSSIATARPWRRQVLRHSTLPPCTGRR